MSSTKQSERIKAILFDFDGTLSTLRAGWEETMAPFFKEAIAGSYNLTSEESALLEKEIEAYIDQSTGIQTIFQMRWLVEKVKEKGWNSEPLGEWDYKAEYNRRLLLKVEDRVKGLREGLYNPTDFLIKGSEALLEQLNKEGIPMYIASGTDHPDVVNEAEVLGVKHYFKEIAGAPVGRADCSKEKVIQELLAQQEFREVGLAVIGDGKVEIKLGKENGAVALGLASDEIKREGINPVKQKRLEAAGADFIAGDFTDTAQWLEWLGIDNRTEQQS
ncbi:HAD family hydrolase [Paenibacillus radicis (ex Xue et al. 2023)]|uniref:HAD hydrolase-like protein n=1 Tax=Paenibacillus radicis (ex Xue et al. 2023) TaxID=2972489 RepID=A0ABT1YPC1_9BACL|nr:HAD family hydrolase [Paenibacillus radicis (ex Xue et al. 2023)]MCR8634123.1 HAD hydrolase-like protein [Paenibacillus radicis (ex Xue et al. 2023)]